MTKTAYGARGALYFFAAFLPALSAALIAAQPVTIALITALGAGAVAVAGYVDKTAGKRSCTACDAESNAENATKEQE